jgi:lysyl-tRNA synthetase class 2
MPPAPGSRYSGEDSSEVPEQMRVRLAKRQRLVDAGVAPYPVSVPRSHTLSEIREQYDPKQLGPDVVTDDTVSVAARVVFLRNTGRLCFARLRAGDGTELQVMLSEAGLGAQSLADFKALVDIGDHLAVTGVVVTSRSGELSVQASSWQLAAKALRPLPNQHKPLSDEARIRMRYVDLIVRPEARDTVRGKAAVLRSLRSTLDDQGYVEVETPVLQLTNGGAAARPFRTHLNALDQDMLLRIALELHLKRTVVGGVEKVYEIGRTFRNEGLDSTHAPEFSMLEAYEAYGDAATMAALTRQLVVNAARALDKTVIEARDGSSIDLSATWRHASLLDLVSQAVDAEVTIQTPPDTLRRYADLRAVDVRPEWGAGELILRLYEKLVETTLIPPTFVQDFPESVRPLAKRHRSKPGFVEDFDLVINGVELVTAFSELNDPVIQRERLLEQAQRAESGDAEAMELDEDFLRALEFGLPPTGGMGMGVDRLVMLLRGVGIRDSILFPLVRPE